MARPAFRTTALLVFAAVLVVAAAGRVGASCLGFQDPEAEFRKAVATSPVVFVGTVVEAQNAGRTAIVTVLEVWRGPAFPARVVVSGSETSGPGAATSVDRSFTAGTKYLFLPEGNRSPFSDNACSFTREFTPDLLQLRPPGAIGPLDRGPPTDDSSGFQIGGLALGSGFGVALVAILWRALRRRSA